MTQDRNPVSVWYVIRLSGSHLPVVKSIAPGPRRERQTPCPHGGTGANGPGPSRPDDQNAGADRDAPPRDLAAPGGNRIGPGHDRSIPEASVSYRTFFAI